MKALIIQLPKNALRNLRIQAADNKIVHFPSWSAAVTTHSEAQMLS
jgi:hypothetical protein